ncbi:TlpA family protein disulfide reductase [Neptuniibacter sp. QD29_5]|uniref:TlpA family protein disulfide reductase n=1 Tax=Neptuniibacter sp. QD29_5 TaxID=3398207 RepID=UPI0039F5ED08
MSYLTEKLKSSPIKKQLTRRQLLKSAALTTAGIGAFGLLAGPSAATENTRGIRGRVAPELKVDHWIDGKGNKTHPFLISEHKGKWIYLKCFQEWCPACHSIGFPNLQKLKAAFPDDETIVAAVIQTTFEGYTINNADALRKNQLKYGLDLPFGHDPGDTDRPRTDPGYFPNTMVSYRTGGTPWVTLIDPNGVVAFDGFHIDIDQLISYLKENA